MMKHYFKMIGVLALMGGLAGSLLSGVHLITSPIIEANREAQQQETVKEFFPQVVDFKPTNPEEAASNEEEGEVEGEIEQLAAENENPITHEVVGEEGDTYGYMLRDTAQGYAGDIHYYVGVDQEGYVEGIYVVEHEETPGIGDIIEEEHFKEQFVDKHYEDNVAQEVDAVTGATVSSRAMATSIQNALDYTARNYLDEEGVEIDLADISAGEYTGEAMGEMDSLKVEVTTEEGRIKDVEVIDHDETPDYFAEAAEEIPEKIVERQDPEEVDTVSGATGSSRGIIEAAKDALEKAYEKEGGEFQLEEVSAGEYTGEAMGQMDTIKVEVVAGEGTIQEINILEHEETPEYLADAKEEIPPQILEEQKLDGVDLVSGATGSSEGILEATREALEKAMEN